MKRNVFFTTVFLSGIAVDRLRATGGHAAGRIPNRGSHVGKGCGIRTGSGADPDYLHLL